MPLLEQIQHREAEQQRAEREQRDRHQAAYVAICWRAAQDKSAESDADTLSALLKVLGYDTERFESDVETVKHAAELEQLASQRAKAAAAFLTAHRMLVDARVCQENAIKSAQTRLYHAQSEQQRTGDASNELHMLRKQRSDLFVGRTKIAANSDNSVAQQDEATSDQENDEATSDDSGRPESITDTSMAQQNSTKPKRPRRNTN